MTAPKMAPGLARRPVIVPALVPALLLGASLVVGSQPATTPATRVYSLADAERAAVRPATPRLEPGTPVGGRDDRAPDGDTSAGSVTSRPPGRLSVEVQEPAPGIALGPGRGSTAVYLGDSFTSGWKGAGIGERGWPRLVGEARDWRTVNLAVAGTGFKNPGWTGQPIAALVTKAVRQHPDLIILAGGHNDSRWSPAATARAADAVIDRLRAAAPNARLVVVGPIWQDGNPPRRCLALRDHLRAKSAVVGATFIDPLAEGWFSGANHRLIGPDALHPTNAGHRFIADRVLAALGA